MSNAPSAARRGSVERRWRSRAEAMTPTEDYLMGMPHLPENLEAGLEALGIDVTDAEEDFLEGDH